MSDNTKQSNNSSSNQNYNNISKGCDTKKEQLLENQKCSNISDFPKCDNTYEDSTSLKREDKNIEIEESRNNNLVCKGCGENLTKKLSCPVCLKNKINSYFCNQECFKRSWKEHSKMHKSEKENNEKDENKGTKQIEKNNFTEITIKELLPQNYDPTNRKYWIYDNHLSNFINYDFTGNLRPWPISKMNYVPDHIEKPDYAITSIPASELKYKRKSDIYVNNSDEIERIKEACILGRKTLDYAHSLVCPGITTDYRPYSGHGVGKLFHSNPTIPHFRKNKVY